ncbi:MAG: 30S ribosomal protein S4 [Bifidobacteriaceae bacterium]|jgi:small subunit ribosomal protein S4|nr:30S ribosomal protein S4 [Bifidobacteriaceae bacterium]
MSSVTKSRRQVRLSRALGVALTPKAKKYFDKRKARNKNVYPPGEHGGARKRADSDYALRLKEKQRLRAYYALREKQLRKVYEGARRLSGLTGEVMVEKLESRLDSIVMRAGFARTILQARQAVVHRHIMVDGKILDRPGASVKPGQTIQIKPTSQISKQFQVAALGSHQDALGKTPEYLDVQIEKLIAKLVRPPLRKEVPIVVNEQFVVEYYAR